MIEVKQLPSGVQVIVTVDPGALGGWAVFKLGSTAYSKNGYWDIVSCGLARTAKGERPPSLRGHNMVVACVGELPQHQRTDDGARTNNLFTTSLRLGMLAEATGADYFQPRNPHSWKGSVDKAVHNSRCLKRLSESELHLLNNCLRGDGTRVLPSELNNVIDAIGLGLVTVGRW